jgi:hypothetical protein
MTARVQFLRRLPHRSPVPADRIVKALVVAIVSLAVLFSWSVVTTGPSPSEGSRTDAVFQVRECMRLHRMPKANSKSTTSTKSLEGEPEGLSGGPAGAAEVRIFRSCSWPPAKWADPDGFNELKVITIDGPVEGAASGLDVADRFFSDCHQVEVLYTFVHQAHEPMPPIRVTRGHIIEHATEKEWKPKVGDATMGLGFGVQRDEAVVLRGSHVKFDSAKCVA